MGNIPPLLIDVQNLAISFALHGRTIPVLHDVSFSVRKSASVALVGESGAGKSVCSKALLGLLPSNATIDHGHIFFTHPRTKKIYDLAKTSPKGRRFRRLRGRRISMIFQEPMTSFSPVHKIGNQIEEMLWLHRKLSRQESHQLTLHMLERVGFPDPQRAYRSYPFELSGGMRQRAMIAMALVCKPALVIADEPTTALDVTIQAQILKLIKDLQQEFGMALLLITHDLGVVANLVDEMVVLYRGHVIERGAVEDLFFDPHHPYLKALLRAVPRLSMKPGERLTPVNLEGSQSPMDFALPTLEDRSWQLWDAIREPTGYDPSLILKVNSISKSFTPRRLTIGKSPSRIIKAVDEVSFDIKRGECLGLVGESGSGKTTLSKMILGAIQPDEGDILFRLHEDEGLQSLKNLSKTDQLQRRRKMQMIFQDPYSSLNPHMSIYEIIAEPLIIHSIGTSSYHKKMVKHLLQLVGLDPSMMTRHPHHFSGGQRQRIAIARALALRPELMICDEPVSALDVSIQAQILNLLKDLQTKLGLTYLFISHNLGVVNYIADRIAVMYAGCLVELAPKDVLFKHPFHPYTKALLAAVPEPDPTQPLDFNNIDGGFAINPDLWPEAFHPEASTEICLIDEGREHYVRVDLDLYGKKGAFYDPVS